MDASTGGTSRPCGRTCRARWPRSSCPQRRRRWLCSAAPPRSHGRCSPELRRSPHTSGGHEAAACGALCYKRPPMAEPQSLEYQKAPPEPPKGALGTIFLIVFVDLLGFGIIIPLLPRYVPQFTEHPVKVTLLFSVFSVFQFIGAPVLGLLSDRYG